MERDTIGFVMYRDYEEYFSFLSTEEKGLLLDAIFGYAFQKREAEGLSRLASLAFAFVKNQIDRDQDKYEKKCRTNRKNGQFGGRPPKGAADSCEAEPFSEEETFTKSAESAPSLPEPSEPRYFFDDPEFLSPGPSAEDSPAKKEAPEVCRGAEKEREAPVEAGMSFEDRLFQKQVMEDFFNKFWRAYPKKESRADAFEAFKKIAPDRALTNIRVEAVKGQARSEAWRREGGRYIPYAKKWLEGRRWEDSPDSAAVQDYPPDELPDPGSFETDDFFEAAIRHSYETFS